MAISKTKKPVQKINGVAPSRKSAATSKSLSNEIVISSDSSDSDDDSNSDDLNVPAEQSAKSKTPTKALKASVVTKMTNEKKGHVNSYDVNSSLSSSDEEDSELSDEDGTDLRQANGQLSGLKRKTTSQEETASEDLSSEAPRENKRPRVNGEVDTWNTSEVRRRPYLPPNGYRRMENPSHSSISTKDLQQKTVFHIAAPAELPLPVLESINIASMRPGKSLFAHEGVEYTAVEGPAQETAIFLPHSDGVKAAMHSAVKSYNIRPSFTLPTIPARAVARNAGSKAAANIATAAVTSIRPQPKGLKMRYKPPGFGRGNPGVIGPDADEQQDEHGSVFQFPKTVGLSTDGDGSRVGDGSAKNKKKHKTTSNTADGLDADIEPKAATPKKLPSGLKKMESQTQGNDEEARRKAEKKAKKAAKLKS